MIGGSLIQLAENPGAVDWNTIKGVVENATTQFSVANLVAVIGGIIAVTIGFVFVWWGVRKAYKAIMGAVKKGKASVG